eukprot:391117-Rhodomonas_salina.1
MVTVDQRDALRAGDDSRHGIVVTLMESQDVVKRQCKKVKTLRSRLLGAGEIKVSTVLTHEIRCIFDISQPEWKHWVDLTDSDCTQWDARDGTRLLATFHRVKKIVIPKRSEYWGMGWRPTKASMDADHEATLMNMYVLQWLLFHSPAAEEGHLPEELFRKMHEDMLVGLTDLDILSEARAKAMKKSAAALSTPTTAAMGAITPNETESSSSGPGSSATDGHVHGPEPGHEPTPDAVALVENKAMDSRTCLNCKQSGHALVCCVAPTRDFLQLPCALCYGLHWERLCLGPVGMRSAWTVKRNNFFYQADNAYRNQRDSVPLGHSRQPQGGGGTGGGGRWDAAPAPRPSGGN